MTLQEGSDAQPVPVDPGAPPPAPLGVTEIEEIRDHDDIALDDAWKVARAEEAAKAGQSGADTVAGAPPAAEPPATPPPKEQQQPAAQAEPQSVPYPRFVEVNTAKAKAEQDAAYWRGVAEARQQQGTQPGQPPAPPTPEQRLASINSEIVTLAEKFDAGEITYADLKKQEQALEQKKLAIHGEMLSAKAPPAPGKPEGDALYLETLTSQLEQQHPWVTVFESVGTKAEWGFVNQQATQNLIDRGIDPTAGALGKYELRKEMATLMDKLGPSLVAERAQAKGIALPGQPPQPSQTVQPPPKSPAAVAREKKLGMAEAAPPNLAAMAGGAGPEAVTVENMAMMSEADYDKLPEATRRKALGIT